MWFLGVVIKQLQDRRDTEHIFLMYYYMNNQGNPLPPDMKAL